MSAAQWMFWGLVLFALIGLIVINILYLIGRSKYHKAYADSYIMVKCPGKLVRSPDRFEIGEPIPEYRRSYYVCDSCGRSFCGDVKNYTEKYGHLIASKSLEEFQRSIWGRLFTWNSIYF